MNQCYTKDIILDRKVLSNIAVAFPEVFNKIYEEATKQLLINLPIENSQLKLGILMSRGGGIGRHEGLKILWDLYSRAGSIPVPGTLNIMCYKKSNNQTFISIVYKLCDLLYGELEILILTKE